MRLLVAGGGLIGSRHIAHAIAHPGVELAGVIDPDPAVRGCVDAPGFAGIDAVDVQADAIVLATPTGLHAAHAAAAARRGWHMLIEKPVAGNVAEAEALAEVVAETGVRCLVGHHRRYHDAVQVLKQTIETGAIGQPVTSTLIWAMKKPDTYFAGNWRTAGGSPVMINLVHDIDLLRYLFGEVTQVCGFGAGPVRGAGRIESGAVALRFASGLTATISFADTTPSPWGFEAGTGENPNIAATGHDMWWVAGTAGAMSFPSLTLWQGGASWAEAPKPAILPARSTIPLVAQLDHFIDVVDRRAEPLVGLADATESLRVTTEIETLLAAQVACASPSSRGDRP